MRFGENTGISQNSRRVVSLRQSEVSQRGCEASRVVTHDRAVLPLEPVDHESGLSFEMPKGIHVVGVYHYDNEMDVPSFLNDMSDSDPVEHTCCSKTALHDGRSNN